MDKIHMLPSFSLVPCLLAAASWALALTFANLPCVGMAAETSLAEPVERSLQSGTRMLLWPRAGSGTVLITVAVAAGSQDEDPNMAGLSHYLEHLLFDGFDGFDERGVTEAFELRSAYVNAFTREQTTVFFALAPAEEAVATAELLIGMLVRSNIVPETFEKERGVILEELAKDQASPDSVKEERLRGAMWQATPLGRPVGGSPETVAATGREDVIRYWQNRYGPGAWRVLITGDLPIEGLEEVAHVFDPLSQGKAITKRTDPLSWPGWGQWDGVNAPEESAAGGGMPPMSGMGHGHGGPGAGSDGGQLALVVATPESCNRSEMDIVARWLGDPSGPLLPLFTPHLATSVSAGLVPHDPRDLLEIRIEAQPGIDPEDLLARLLGALQGAADGPGDSDVLRVQRAAKAERVLTGQRLHYAAVFYGDSLATARGSLIESLEPAEVSPERARATAGQLLTDITGRTRAAWIGVGGPRERVALPEAIAPPVAAAETSFEAGVFDSLVTTLPNGLVLGILPETGGQVFGVHLLVADRSLREPPDHPGIADLIHRLLPSGTSLSGSAELDRRLVRAGIEVKAADSPMIPFDNRYHVPDFSYVRLEGPAASLEQSLAILAEMIGEPAWDEPGIEAAAVSHRSSRKAGNRGSAVAGQRLYAALLGPSHPQARPVSGPADTEPPSDSELKAAWGRWPEGYFAPERIVLTLASPVPASEALEMVEDLFGGGPASPPVRGPYPKPQPTEPDVDVGDEESPQITILWGRLIEVADEDRAALLVAVNALSDRMVALIREEEGLAYRLGAGVRSVPGSGWLISASVGTRPENRDRVVELMDQIAADLSAQPVDAEVLARLAARDRRSRMLRSLSAASRAYRLGRAIFEGPQSPLRVGPAQRAAVTPEQVQKAAAKYLGIDDMLMVVAK